MEESKNGSKYHVPNLERALEVLELLAKHNHGLSLTEMVDHLGYPKNSVFRITRTLEDKGYINRSDDTRLFTLTHKLLDLGYGAISEYSIVERSIDIMRQVRDELKETVLIGILADTEGVVLEQVPGKYHFRFMVDPGRRFPLHASAPGKAMWAFLPAHQREHLLTTLEFTKFNDNTITDPQQMRTELQNVRQAGYAIDHAEELHGVHCVGAPILDKHGFPVASIWTTGPSERMPDNILADIGKKIAACAERISKRLGSGISNTGICQQ